VEIEHPDGCPRLCAWWPGASVVAGCWADPEMYGCYVEYELQGCGLDSIEGEVDGISVSGPGGWRKLRPGRYILEPWFEPAYSTPNGWVEPSGGLSLVGRERPRWWDRFRWSRLRSDAHHLRWMVRRQQITFGDRALMLRGPKMDTLFSERNGYAGRVVPLGRGWRMIVKRRKR
jgi:hypothetical protein